MPNPDREIFNRLLCKPETGRAGTDELQGLLLQVVFALLMVFVIAYFMFVAKSEKEREEQVMELTKQKLSLALEKVSEDFRIRYGLNALMVQGSDGKRVFEADGFVSKGKIVMTPATRVAFSSGSKAAFIDYNTDSDLHGRWRTKVLKTAEIDESTLKEDERDWFVRQIDKNVENVRLDVRGVQRSLAARLQKQWIENPLALEEVLRKNVGVGAAATASEIAHELKTRSLELLAEQAESEMLP